MNVLAINPGSTSTKLAVFEDETPRLVRTLRHSVEELSAFPQATDQFEFRKDLVLRELEADGIPLQFDAVIGRGGLFKPIPGGVYAINEQMLHDARHASRPHACNLGCLIAADIASRIPGCRAFIADPGVTDELDEVARITGSPLMPRITIWHALNQRAIARRYAREKGTHYEDLNLIICHLGGGISIGTHLRGRCIDVNNALDGEGPFSPERAGTLPAGPLIDLCYSGRFTREELKKRISGRAGLAAHLGTTDVPAIVARIAEGDQHAELVLNAMVYQTAKSIGAAATVLCGRVDAILLTGGIAHSDYVVSRLTERVSFLAPVHVYPGEDELEALAQNALGALRGELEVQKYQ
ncbi:MAG: butyrate kinase [Candidatus Bacteroides intestinipullorum]|uniref:Probable butyrate kinase n=1 Tax=Candidatus Bacteroides intestinipullorum TaxID=2838471 RepID=A0A9E2KJ42_9BACE|nr:butyrate kinase [Candidatus Bacteroides intestinipullorum]